MAVEIPEIEHLLGRLLGACQSFYAVSGGPANSANRLSPIFKTPAEVRRGSPLFLDMLDDGRLLYDRGGFFAGELAALKARLDKLGSKRIWRGDSSYWDLKPDFKPGDEIVLF